MEKMKAFENILNGTITENELAVIRNELDKLARIKEKRAEKTLAHKKENEPLKTVIISILGSVPMTATELRAACSETHSIQKFSAMARQLVEEGRAHDVIVKRENGYQKGYTL